MKTIGLLGGMSWESTAIYYRAINEGVKNTLGGFHSAKILLNSLEFGHLEQLMQEEQWDTIEEILIANARTVDRAGADFLVVCTNTMHKIVPKIQEHISIPILHIVDATAGVLLAKGIKKVGLLGTTFTMEHDFYKGRLMNKFGIEVVVPIAEDRNHIHRIIDEICMGDCNDHSKQEYLRIITSLQDQGAEAVILGCTEIGILVKDGDADIPLLDTTLIHAEAAVKMALSTQTTEMA